MGSPALRAVFGEALGAVDAPVTFIQCRVSQELAVSRARVRETNPEVVSDATAEVAQRLWAGWSPLDEVAPDQHLIVRADRDVTAIADEVERRLDEVGP